MRGFDISAARALVLALGLAALPTAAHAAKLNASGTRSFHYNTSGKVYAASAPRTVSGPAQLKFDGVQGQSFYPNSGQSIQLGQFSVDSTIPGLTTTFDGTPFRVQIQVPERDKTSTVPVLGSIFSRFGRDLKLKTVTANSVILRGHLNGIVNGDGSTNLKATVDSVRLGSLDPGTADHVTKFTFPIRFGELKLPADWATAATAYPKGVVATQVMPTPTPEPASALVFVAALGGLVVARRRSKGSAAA
ncbi:PEP-CTERM sorting domain-containing protein [Tundrisphaera sp. TA3]|uniref:PEP-CTERM sorting domain-containing protein n=1 Tax=Tundrisphaera sp. TA3 TaxID=3435775 RepID=UPI003EBFB311